MNSTDTEIRIPLAVFDLPITVSEKIVLGHLTHFPNCSDARLIRLIGGTRREMENLLQRLRSDGYIEPTGTGRTRNFYPLYQLMRHKASDTTRSTSVENARE